MKQTKWQELTKWLSKHPTFGWSQLNKAFGHRPSSLNSYTTYLNTLRRAGYVEQTARGQYKVRKPLAIMMVTQHEATMAIDMNDNAKLYEAARRTNSDLFERIRDGRAENQKLLQDLIMSKKSHQEAIDWNTGLRTKLIDSEKRAEELSHQIVRMDARARGNKFQRLMQVIRRELNR